MGIIEAGSRLPDIRLKDQEGNEIDLSTLRGRRLLLSFHPLAWTGVCQRQMEALEAESETIEALNAQAFGLSVDASPTKKAWADAIGVVKTRLLSDFWPHGGVAKALGIFDEETGLSARAAVIADEEGIVRFAKVYPIGDVPDLKEQLEALESL